jgi:predicted DNA-binding transcriptional regulator YafY
MDGDVALKGHERIFFVDCLSSVMAINKEKALSVLHDAFYQRRKLRLNDIAGLMDFHQINYSERSLSRWIQTLREEYDLPVQFNRREGYFEVLEADRPVSPTGLLKYTLDSQFLRDLLLRNKKAAAVIHPDNRAPALNHHHFTQLVNACLEHRWVEVRHQKFDAPAPKTYVLKPFFLKEYLYRWYLIAADTGDGETIKAFGLERLQEVQLREQRFNNQQSEAAADQFLGLMGITGSEIKPVEIVLRTNGLQKRFFETLPLHPRQQLQQIGDDWWEIRFVGKPNLELTQQLVGQLEPIEVVAPESYKEYVIAYLKRNLEVYG